MIAVHVFRRPADGPVLTARQIRSLNELAQSRPHVRELLVSVPGPHGRRLLRVESKDSGLGLADGVLGPDDD